MQFELAFHPRMASYQLTSQTKQCRLRKYHYGHQLHLAEPALGINMRRYQAPHLIQQSWFGPWRYFEPNQSQQLLFDHLLKSKCSQA